MRLTSTYTAVTLYTYLLWCAFACVCPCLARMQSLSGRSCASLVQSCLPCCCCAVRVICIITCQQRSICRFLRNITIPAAFIKKSDGDILKRLLEPGNDELDIIFDCNDVLPRRTQVRGPVQAAASKSYVLLPPHICCCFGALIGVFCRPSPEPLPASILAGD